MGVGTTWFSDCVQNSLKRTDDSDWNIELLEDAVSPGIDEQSAPQIDGTLPTSSRGYPVTGP